MTEIRPKNIYFLGIGGIGMSAIARYYLLEGARVGGYDRTETALTRALAAEGADIHYEDDPTLIGEHFRNPEETLVVYTPALPADHAETAWFRDRGFRILKRSQILGLLAADKYVMAVAGTHGKTTTTLTAWLNHVAGGGGSAFLGGISKNFDNNFVYGPGNRLAVEADEFDRSFLQLWPDAAVITSADADHLDIYGTHEELRRTFARFAGQIRPGGTLIIKQGVDLPITNPDIRIYTYACDAAEADFRAANLHVQPDGTYRFDIVCPDRTLTGCRLGRLRPPSRRAAGGALLRAEHVPRPEDHGHLPAAPLHPHAGFPPRLRPGAFAGRRGGARAHLSGPRRAHRGRLVGDDRRSAHRSPPRRPAGGGSPRNGREPGRHPHQLRGRQHREPHR